MLLNLKNSELNKIDLLVELVILFLLFFFVNVKTIVNLLTCPTMKADYFVFVYPKIRY